MRKKKKVTIYDIARRLGVSTTTVSRALNGKPGIGQETRQAVKEMAREMGFRPNTLAASLRKKQTYTIGVIVPWINRPFISTLISGIEETANEAGYNVLIAQSGDSYQKEVGNAYSLYANRVDGLIVSLAMETRQYDHLQLFQEGNIPLVLVDRTCEELKADKVMIDNFQAAFTITEHLIRTGRRRIAHLAGAVHRNIYRLRLEGYRAALRQYDLVSDETLIVYHEVLSPEEAVKSMEQLLNLTPPPDAVFSANDTAAVHALLYARKRGVRIPEDLAFAGFNDDPFASIVEPQLTTVFHPAREMGNKAAELLLRQIDRKEPSTETVLIDTLLLVRASTQQLQSLGG
jgi:LacI family transcriptional regulator